MNPERIRQFFQDYHEVLLHVSDLEGALRTSCDWETWCCTLKDRAQYFQRIYQKTSSQLKTARELFSAPKPPLDNDTWEQLRTSMMLSYRSQTHDLALILELAKVLEIHYASSDNLEAQTDVSLCLGYTNLEFSRILRQPFGARSVQAYRKIVSLWPRYGEINSHAIHQSIVVSFANLVTVGLVLGLVPLEEAYQLWEDMKTLQSSPAFTALRETEADVCNLLDMFIDRFETDAYALANSYDKTSESPRPIAPDLMNRVVEMTRQHYASLPVKKVCTPDMYQVVVSQCDFEFETGKRTGDSCWRELHDFYMSTRDEVAKVPEADIREIDVISYYVTCLASLIAFLTETSMPHEEKQVYFRQYQADIRAFIADYDTRTGHSYTLNSALEELAFLPDSYKLFESSEEKIDYVFRLVIVRHCTTLLHSLMVSVFAQTILGALIDEQPTLLVGYHDLHDVADVQAHREELLQFARNAALLHDVGKNAMLSIIETQHRPLTDAEFGIIRAHPSRGAEYLSIDPDFKRFSDITRGHHKFYNGQGGYPNDFDNTKSPERLMIDIITLCDCLDAATDQYGRNYQQAKTVDEVLEEFQQGAGVRYNPDLVALLSNSPHLLQSLRDIAGPERLHIYYETYKKYFI